ncbi:glycosyltransferase family 2 protein [Anaerostipes faecalis]|uniref:glycosyltransferase family 2 protein n=1 Tax=Anaerostipes faecalis TaxID=2738446 RepID=UPI003F066FB6
MKKPIFFNKELNSNCFVISVIVPVYNTAEHLEKCLDSIINNTYKNLEIICINDGSKDNSIEILRQYEKKDLRIHIIDGPNQGVSSARNQGLKMATGEYIAFIDSDDWIHHRFFEILLKQIIETNTDIAVGGFGYTKSSRFEEETIVVRDTHYKLCDLSSIMQDYFLKSYIWGRIYKKDVIQSLLFMDGLRLGEDTIFNLLAITIPDTIKMSVTEEKLYYYYAREESVVHTLSIDNWLPFCHRCLDIAEKGEIDRVRQIFLLEGIKKVLSTRYYMQFRVLTPIQEQEINDLQIKSKRLLSRISGIHFIQRIIFRLFICYPQIYKMYRRMMDPSLLEWEQQEKEM